MVELLIKKGASTCKMEDKIAKQSEKMVGFKQVITCEW